MSVSQTRAERAWVTVAESGERALLMRELDLPADDLVDVEGLLDLTACFAIADLNFPYAKYPFWEPVVPYRLAHEHDSKTRGDIFAIIRDRDLVIFNQLC